MLAIILRLFRFVRLLGSGHQAVAVENLALRRQLAAYKRSADGLCSCNGVGSSGSVCLGSGTAGATRWSSFNPTRWSVGNLVFTFNALARFDDKDLTARFTPLYGLGYSF